jgi:hypothetical protein
MQTIYEEFITISFSGSAPLNYDLMKWEANLAIATFESAKKFGRIGQYQ